MIKQADNSGYQLDAVIEGYLDYKRDVQRKAHRSVVDMRCTFKRVCSRMDQKKPCVPLWKLNLEDYIDWVQQERDAGLSAASIAKDVSHLRGLLDYAWRSNRCTCNVLDGFKLQDNEQRKAPRVLSLDEARLLVEACPRETSLDRRDRVVILLLYGCGLRTGELRGLDVKDVCTERQELFVRKAKGDIERYVPVPSGVWTELLVYLAERKGRRGPLFLTPIKKARITTHDICELVGKAVERAELAGTITPKTLRHTFATHLVEQGVDLAVIASLMGHRSPSETGVYLHVLPGKKEDAVARLPGGVV